ncbi:hypothetical protein ACVV2G_28720 [Streptomyces ziwulingensis]
MPIAAAVDTAREGTRVYGPHPVRPAVLTATRTVFEVTGESSLEAFARAFPEGRTDARRPRPDGRLITGTRAVRGSR